MNSSELPGTKRAGLLGQARASFDWIELLAVPIALSVMETQPIVLVLTFLATLFLGDGNAVLLGAESITLLLLGLHWWARAVSALTQGRSSTTGTRLLQFLGLFLAIAITLVTHISLLNNTPALFFAILLIIGFWLIGMHRVQTGPDDEYVLASFKLGLGVLLAILILTLLSFRFNPVPPALHDGLTYALPTFFLSGLLALSFTRIMMIRKENVNAAQRGSAGDPTRGWLLIMTLAWAIVIVSALAFEAFGFQPVVVVASLLLSGLGTVANWLVLLLAPLFSLIRFIPAFPSIQGKLPHQPPSSNGQPPPNLYLAEIFFIALLILLLVFLVALLWILVWVIRKILRRQRTVPDDESEKEIRESLSRELILQTRREQQQRSNSGDLAGLALLDPNSARAHYRELLQELAQNEEKLARRANETPSEYGQRLLALLKETSSAAPIDATPTDPAMLDELTAVYMQERYGGKHPHLEHDAYVQGWIPRFVRRLANTSLTSHI